MKTGELLNMALHISRIVAAGEAEAITKLANEVVASREFVAEVRVAVATDDASPPIKAALQVFDNETMVPQ